MPRRTTETKSHSTEESRIEAMIDRASTEAPDLAEIPEQNDAPLIEALREGLLTNPGAKQHALFMAGSQQSLSEVPPESDST